MAFSDENLDRSETPLIIDFCKSIGINQEQLNRLRKEVIASLKQQGKVCPSCGAESDQEARFCPKCGSSFDAAPMTYRFSLRFHPLASLSNSQIQPALPSPKPWK